VKVRFEPTPPPSRTSRDPLPAVVPVPVRHSNASRCGRDGSDTRSVVNSSRNVVAAVAAAAAAANVLLHDSNSDTGYRTRPELCGTTITTGRTVRRRKANATDTISGRKRCVSDRRGTYMSVDTAIFRSACRCRDRCTTLRPASVVAPRPTHTMSAAVNLVVLCLLAAAVTAVRHPVVLGKCFTSNGLQRFVVVRRLVRSRSFPNVLLVRYEIMFAHEQVTRSYYLTIPKRVPIFVYFYFAIVQTTK